MPIQLDRTGPDAQAPSPPAAGQPDAVAFAALRGALSSLVGGAVLDAVWGATARALAGAAPDDVARALAAALDAGTLA